ncbi:MAG: hypothetical protein NZM42_14785, partial [Gemmatales bacterium]|nr:hypothetical protein [Gemmatales bacterium]
ILTGGKLYEDVAYPYGWMPAYLYAGAAGLFGNGAGTYVGFMTFMSTVHIIMVYASIRRFQSAIMAACVCILGFLPVMHMPAALFGSYMNAAYIPIERCLLTALALVYRSPSQRSERDALLLGGLLGLMQFTKFGGCFFAGAAVVVLDMLTLRIQGVGRPGYFRWIRLSLVTLVGFLAIEAIRIALAFGTLPKAIAQDVVWPAYTARLYSTVDSSYYWPSWISARFFVGQQLPCAVGLVLSGAGLLRLVASAVLRDKTEASHADEKALLLLPLFYFLATVKYMGHVHTFYQYAWCLMFGVPYALVHLRSVKALAVAALLIPATMLMLKATFVNRPPHDIKILLLPNGEVLYCDPETVATAEGIQREYTRLGTVGTGQPDKVLIYRIGAGYHFYFNLPRFSRHVWYIPYYVRPYDAPALLDSLSDTRAFVVLGVPEPDEAMRFMEDPLIFPPEVAEAAAPRMGTPLKIGKGNWVIPINSAPK